MLTVNVFSNLCETDPARDAVFKTLDSFSECFGSIRYSVNIFVHPSPFRSAFPAYKDAMEDYFSAWNRPVVIRTSGLADGYKRSILSAKTPYLFQLEHDWLFDKALIKHSLEEIMAAMTKGRAEYFRFGKEPNRPNQYGHQFRAEPLGAIQACAVRWRSNNPHIIDATAYRRKYLPFLRPELGGSSGIEECLPDAMGAYVYGGLGCPPTIRHANGRSRLRSLERRIGKPAYRMLKATRLLDPAFRLLA